MLRVPIAGGEPETIAVFPSDQEPLMLSLDETHVWWLITGDESGVWRYAK